MLSLSFSICEMTENTPNGFVVRFNEDNATTVPGIDASLMFWGPRARIQTETPHGLQPIPPHFPPRFHSIPPGCCPVQHGHPRPHAKLHPQPMKIAPSPPPWPLLGASLVQTGSVMSPQEYGFRKEAHPRDPHRQELLGFPALEGMKASDGHIPRSKDRI